jgi:hypothetical protein
MPRVSFPRREIFEGTRCPGERLLRLGELHERRGELADPALDLPEFLR